MIRARSVLPLLGVATALPPYAHAAPDPAKVAEVAEVDIAIDPRVVAVNVTMWLAQADDDDWMASLPAYRAAMRAHFGPHRDHRAVQLAGQLARAGFTFDAPVGWALHHDRRSWLPRAEVPAYYTERAGSAELLEAYRIALQRFSAEADVGGFLEAMGPLHDAELARVRKALMPGDVAALEAFYGDDLEASYHVLVTPTLGPHHHGVTVHLGDGRAERYQVSNTLRWESEAELDLGLENLLLHEFGHALVRPAMATMADRLDRLGPSLMPPISDPMREQAYPTWPLAVEEHLVRAATCRLVQQRHGEDVARACLAGDAARGFAYVVPLYDALGDYQARRSRFPTLASYGRPIVRRLEELARNPEGPVWDEVYAWRPRVQRGATVVLPTASGATPSLQQAARSLATRQHGHRMITDREALTRPEADYVIVGPPEANLFAARHTSAVPLRRDETGMQVGSVHLEGSDVGVSAVLPAPSGHTWTWITGSSVAMAEAATLHARDRGWVAVSGRGDVCASGEFPPDPTLARTPRDLSCQPEPVRRPWVPRGLGQSLVWSRTIPPELWPDPFAEVIADADPNCGLDTTLVEVDCREPPCIAQLRVAEGSASASDLVGCPSWEVPYGPTVHLLRAVVPCPDGPDERVELVAPTPPTLQRSIGEDHLGDRLTYRWMDVLGSWTCSSAMPEPTVEARTDQVR